MHFSQEVGNIRDIWYLQFYMNALNNTENMGVA